MKNIGGIKKCVILRVNKVLKVAGSHRIYGC